MDERHDAPATVETHTTTSVTQPNQAAEKPATSSNWQEILLPALLGFLAITLLALGLAVRNQGNRADRAYESSRDTQLVQYETRSQIYEIRAAALRTYLHACRTAQAQGVPHDDCARVEADWTNALAAATEANEKAVQLRTELKEDE